MIIKQFNYLRNSGILHWILENLHRIILKIIEYGNRPNPVELLRTLVDRLLEEAVESQHFFVISHGGRYKIVWRFGFRTPIDQRWLIIGQHSKLIFAQLIIVESIPS